MLKTALQLKKAIDAIPTEYDPIGHISQASEVYIRSHEHHFERWEDMKQDQEDQCDSDQEDKEDKEDKEDIITWLYKVRDAHEKKFQSYHNGKSNFEGDLTISVNNFNYSGPYKDFNNLKELFDVSSTAAFGDTNTMTTVVDEKIRKARDLTDFTVSQSIIDRVSELWSVNFYPQQVRVVPYKINIYGPDGKFKEHKDTPDVNLVGTFLLGLSPKSCNRSLMVKDGDKCHYWHDSNVGTWCAFYPDLPHSVENTNNNYRGTIAFKIFSIDESDNEFICDNKFTGDLPTEPLGLVLSYDYSLNTDSLKGVDNLWYNMIRQLNCKSIEIVPILIKTSFSHGGYDYDSELPEGTMDVYLCDDGVIESITNGNKIDINYRDIPFVKMSYSGYQWKYNYEEYIEHTGNESRPEEEDSIYLHRAMIVKF